MQSILSDEVNVSGLLHIKDLMQLDSCKRPRPVSDHFLCSAAFCKPILD